MGVLKTIIASAISGILLAGPGHSLPHSPSERVRVFATCAGRLSALEEYQRMFDGAQSEITAERKSAFDDLIEALLPVAKEDGLPGRQALAWQIEEKLAQSVLLQRATFNTDPRAAARSAAAAQTRLAECDGLLLGA